MTKFLNKNSPFVSIVVPTLNEEKNLPRLFRSLRELKYPKEKYEVIIVDGGSSDKTVAIAKRYGARVFLNPKKLRGAGCQIGVEKAQGEFVAFTDADCRVPVDWLLKLLKELKLPKGNMVSVGGPNVTPKDDTSFAKASGEVIGLLTKAGARYGFWGGGVRETFHNSGCNVLYRKKAIDDAGGFNPELVTCEDEELDFRLREKGYKLLFTPEVVVDHYRRPSYKKILIQAYRFAFGRAQAIKKHFRMARWFHFVPSIFFVPIFWPFLFFGFLVLSLFLSFKKGYAPFYVYFLIFFLWFLGWGIGFIKGFLSGGR